MLSVESLVVELGDRRVVDQVSLAVGPGEVVVVLGPSGCGKTTLLRAIAGLVEPSAGSIRLDGRDLAGVPVHKRGLGLMFQEQALFPHLDVAGNVEFGLRMRGDGAATRRERVAEVLDLVRLGGFEHRPIAELSGGERQRVALARALAPAPDALMLDEPLSSLDRALRDELVVELQELFDRLGLAVVYVTHDQGEALALADRVLVLRDGAVAQLSTPAELWERPADGWVARFVGAAAIFDLSVRDGRVTAPWGETLSVEPADAERLVAVVSPSGLGLAAEGMPGTVEGHLFAGDRVRVRVALDPDLDARAVEVLVAGPPPAVGSAVRVAVDAATVRLVPRG